MIFLEKLVMKQTVMDKLLNDILIIKLRTHSIEHVMEKCQLKSFCHRKRINDDLRSVLDETSN